MVRPLIGPLHPGSADPFALTEHDLSFAGPDGALGGDHPHWLADGDFPSALLGDSAGIAGANDGSATWNYYIESSTSEGVAHSPGPDVTSQPVAPQAVTLTESYEASAPHSGIAALDLFAKGGPGGGGGGGGGGSGVPQPYSYSFNGITLNINWDSSVGSAPKGFVTGLESAVSSLLNTLGPAIGATNLAITLAVGWGEVGGSKLSAFALGQSSTYVEQRSYAELQNSAMHAYLPTDATNGTGHYWVPTAEEKAIGLSVQDSTLTLDGAVGFGSRFSWNFTGSPGSGQYDFVAVAKHEITEAMGRIALLGGTVGGVANSYTPFDLFRFTDVGAPSLTGGANAYFSFDGGNSSTGSGLSSDRTYFNTQAGGDWGDWQSSGAHSAGNDAYNAFASTGVAYSAGAVDQLVMKALGYGSLPT